MRTRQTRTKRTKRTKLTKNENLEDKADKDEMDNDKDIAMMSVLIVWMGRVMRDVLYVVNNVLCVVHKVLIL